MRSLSLMLLLLLACTSLATAEERSIKVSAKSEIKVAPDEVVLMLAVTTRDKSLKVAKQKNDQITADFLKLTKTHSIPAAEVKVQNMNVTPPSSSRRSSGSFNMSYEANPTELEFVRSMEIRLTDFHKLEPFLSEAFETGVSLQSLHFRVSNQREHQFQARRLAVLYAREKAEHLAELTGMRLGTPLKIQAKIEENWDAGGFGGGFWATSFKVEPLPQQPQKVVAHQPQILLAAMEQTTEDSPKTLIEPGLIVISSHVTIKYEMLKPEK